MFVCVVSTYLLVLFYSILAQNERGPGGQGHGGQDTNRMVPTPHVPQKEPNTEEIEDSKSPRDQHTFVALLDLVFTDQCKRTCTGAIIHDYVVVTAAHCFVKESTVPELTVSFVVIGTKKMFDTGYEQYLPIERYKIHPKFKGWTADLALVYTFAAMTADKPGKILPLAGEKIINPVDTSITVLSWGKSSERQQFQEGIHVTQLRSVTVMDEREQYATATKKHDLQIITERSSVIQARRKFFKQRSYAGSTEKVFPRNRLKPYFANWRRKMGTQENNMTVEVFHFANMQSCKKIVEQTMPPLFTINAEGNDVVCYTSDEYFIAIEDSGAPAIRYGRLFAITVGGVEADGEHVAIGMRISCYCSWIAANLPSGGNMLDCCEDCCALVHKPATSAGRNGPNNGYRGYFEDHVAL